MLPLYLLYYVGLWSTTHASLPASSSLKTFNRTLQHKACAGTCALHRRGQVYVQHLRKAGGTLLRVFFASYRCSSARRPTHCFYMSLLPE